MVLDFNQKELTLLSTSLYTEMAQLKRFLELERDELERSELREDIRVLSAMVEKIDSMLFESKEK